MGYHPKDVADFGTAHGFDLTVESERKELAEEYVKAGKAPGGMAASTIAHHLEHYVKGERVGLYEPDGSTLTPTEPGYTWDVQGDYGYGWETVTAEENQADALVRKAEYDAAEPRYPHRAVRVKEG